MIKFIPILVVVHGEIKLKVDNPQVNGRIYHLIQLMKESENREDTYHYKYIKLADSIVKYNFIAMGLTYLFTRSFAKAISFLLVDYSCALKLSDTCCLPHYYKKFNR